MTFRWVPGEGADREALDRIRLAFPQPREAMGEAWFMGQRRTFPQLVDQLDALSNTELSGALDEIVSGQCIFGYRDEWRDWHHYLLVERYRRIHEHYPLLEVFISGLFAIYPSGVPDTGLRRDMLLTVGRSLMDPECWPTGRIDPERCLNVSPEDTGEYLTDTFKLSAAIFFCLKHLSRDEVGPWLRSALEIKDAFWRAQLLSFAAEAHPVLTGVGSLDEHFSGRHGGLYWDGSEMLFGSGRRWWPPIENLRDAARVFGEAFSNGAIQEWEGSIRQAFPSIWPALGDIPHRCLALYSTEA